MEIQIISPLSRIAKIIAVSNLVLMAVKSGRNQMELPELVLAIANVLQPIIVLQSQLGPEPFIKPNPFAVQAKIMFAVSPEMLEFVAVQLELLVITSTLTPKTVKHSNTMVAKVIATILLLKKLVKIIV